MKRLPLILIAGWGYTGKAMLGLKKDLSEYEIVITSTAELWQTKSKAALPKQPDLSHYAHSLSDLLEPYHGRVGVIGWSMGGIVALEAARKHPGLMSKLVIINGTARFCAGTDDPPGVPLTVVRAMSFGLRRTPDAILTAFHEKAHAASKMAAAEIAKWIIGLGPLNREELVHGLDYLQQTDLRGGLDKLDLPVLVEHGREDRIIPWRAGEWLSRRLAVSQWRCHTGFGHALPIQAPEILAADIRAFLA